MTDEGSPQEAGTRSAASDLVDDQADLAEDFVNGLLEVLGLEGEARAEIDQEDAIFLDVEGPDLALLIGRHGAGLAALQELTRAVVQNATDARTRLLVDVGGYRERREEMLERMAATGAEKVRKTGEAESLEPMTSYERRLVHNALASEPGVSTTSEGEDPERFVVILPAPFAQ